MRSAPRSKTLDIMDFLASRPRTQRTTGKNTNMPDHSKRLRLRLASATLAVCLMAGCATGKDPRDPFEGFNRGVYSFNEELDKAILKPTAEAYKVLLPQFIRSSVSNFFSNINDVVV